MTGRAGDPGSGGTRGADAEHGSASGPALDFIFVPDGAGSGGAPFGGAPFGGAAPGDTASRGTLRLRARFVPAGPSPATPDAGDVAARGSNDD